MSHAPPRRPAPRVLARVLVVLAVLPTVASPAYARSEEQATASPLPTLLTPFERLLDTGADGRVEVSYGPFEHALLSAVHRRGEAMLVTDFALPGGLGVDLLLRPVPLALQGHARVVVGPGGREDRLSPSALAFAGSVRGRSGRVFLGFSRELFTGFLEVEDRRYALSGSRDRGLVTSLGTPANPTPDTFWLPGADWCETHTDVSFLPQREGTLGLHVLGDDPAGPVVRRADLFLECDPAFHALFASSQAAVDYAALLVTAASEIYRRDLGVLLRVPAGYLRLWTTTPPWGTITGFGSITDLRDWWSGPANPLAALPRAAVHALTHPVFGGVSSGTGGACDPASGYGISSVYGTLPTPVPHTSSANWDLLVFAHELGHSLGAVHASQLGIECDDGSGPDRGTLMGYCHLAYGVAQVGMRFHADMQDQVRAALDAYDCLPTISHARGDYDLSGSLRLADLVEFDAHRAQGFVSRAASETFDMNADGRIDDVDRDVLAARIAGKPAATWTSRNGSGTNRPGLEVRTPPILGTPWELEVLTPGPDVPTALTVRTRAVPPRVTPFGELLVGGRRLGSRTALSTGSVARYAVDLPYDPALVGSSASAQAVRLLPSGPELTNAIDFVVSLY